MCCCVVKCIILLLAFQWGWVPNTASIVFCVIFMQTYPLCAQPLGSVCTPPTCFVLYSILTLCCKTEHQHKAQWRCQSSWWWFDCLWKLYWFLNINIVITSSNGVGWGLFFCPIPPNLSFCLSATYLSKWWTDTNETLWKGCSLGKKKNSLTFHIFAKVERSSGHSVVM